MEQSELNVPRSSEALSVAARLFAEARDTDGYKQTLQHWLSDPGLTREHILRIVKLQLSVGDLDDARATADRVELDELGRIITLSAIAADQSQRNDQDLYQEIFGEIQDILGSLTEPAQHHTAQLEIVRLQIAAEDLPGAQSQVETFDDSGPFPIRSQAVLVEAHLAQGQLSAAQAKSGHIEDATTVDQTKSLVAEQLAKDGAFDAPFKLSQEIKTNRGWAEAQLKIASSQLTAVQRDEARKQFAAAMVTV